MLTLRKAQDPRYADHGWLKRSHSLPLADYFDPAHTAVGISLIGPLAVSTVTSPISSDTRLRTPVNHSGCGDTACASRGASGDRMPALGSFSPAR